MNQTITKLVTTALTFKEANDLIALSTELFEIKLAALEKQFNQANSKEKKLVETKAYQLYEAYKKSLKEIETKSNASFLLNTIYEKPRTT